MSAETNAHLIFLGVLVILGPISLLLMVVLLFTNYYPLVIFYLLWCVYDRDTKTRIRRRSEWFRSLKIWHYFREYYPSEFVKTVDLDPSKNYIMGIHPHGVLVAGCLNFVTEVGNFSGKFPGLRPYVLGHELLFLFAPVREIAIPLGLSSVAQESFEYLLKHTDGGTAVVMVPGGVKEQMATKQGNVIHLVLKERKGFIREAIKHGASLVPVFTFGEHELYLHAEIPPGGILHKIQLGVKKYLGMPVINIKGRYQILPLRKPLVTVVGAPIHTDRKFDPSQEDIDTLQEKYIQSLVDLFEAHKHQYGKGDQVLEFI